MGKKSGNTFSWCIRCDAWRWDWKIQKDPNCDCCGATMRVGARRVAWAQGPPPPWRPQQQQQHHQQQLRPQPAGGGSGAPGSAVPPAVGAGIPDECRQALGAFAAELASKGGEAAGALLQFAASLQPPRVEPPTAKKLLDLAAAAHRQALKSKQDLERRQGHLDGRRSELRMQMEKVEADYVKCGEELSAAEAEVKAKQEELEQARTKNAATDSAAAKEGERAAPKMDVDPPPPFDPVAFARQFADQYYTTNVQDLTTDPEGKAGEDGMGNEGGTENPDGDGQTAAKKAKPNGEAADNPDAKKARMSEAMAEGLSKGLAANKAHYEQQINDLKAAIAGGQCRASPSPGAMQG